MESARNCSLPSLPARNTTNTVLASFTETSSKTSALAVSPVRTTTWEFEKLMCSQIIISHLQIGLHHRLSVTTAWHPVSPTFSQWVPVFSLSHALWHCLRGISYVPLALSTRRPRSASGSRPSRNHMPSWHCLRGAHVQPEGPGLLAITCPLGTDHEAPTFSQWVPAFSLSHALWHCLRGISYVPLALTTRRPRSASGSRPSRNHMPSWH